MTSEYARKLLEVNSKPAVSAASQARASRPSRPRKSSSSQEPAKDTKADALKGSLTGITVARRTTTIKLDVNRAQLRKKLLDALKEATQPLTLAELSEKIEVNLEAEPRIVSWLQTAERVLYEAGRYSYKPQHEIRDREQLLQFLRRTPEGTGFNDIKDSYRTVGEDVQALKEAGRIYVVFNHDLQQEVMYPVDEGLEHLRLDDDLVQLWRSTKVPVNATELHAAIKNAGIKTADFAAPTMKRSAQSSGPRQKVKKYRQQRVVTNIHMPQLHKGPQPDQID
jgi:DNA-binding transcriptional ArsR family regulator